MRPALILLPLALLAACATPREQCISEATRDSRILNSLIAETEANIARGYAVETRQEVRSVTGLCTGRTDAGESFTFSCDETQTVNRSIPVAIDLVAEQAKLDSLRARVATDQASVDAAITQCLANFES